MATQGGRICISPSAAGCRRPRWGVGDAVLVHLDLAGPVRGTTVAGLDLPEERPVLVGVVPPAVAGSTTVEGHADGHTALGDEVDVLPVAVAVVLVEPEALVSHGLLEGLDDLAAEGLEHVVVAGVLEFTHHRPHSIR